MEWLILNNFFIWKKSISNTRIFSSRAFQCKNCAPNTTEVMAVFAPYDELDVHTLNISINFSKIRFVHRWVIFTLLRFFWFIICRFFRCIHCWHSKFASIFAFIPYFVFSPLLVSRIFIHITPYLGNYSSYKNAILWDVNAHYNAIDSGGIKCLCYGSC